MSPKRGRPVKERKKSTPLQIRAEPEEKATFYRAAEVSGLAFSAWARERLRAAARKDLRDAGELR
jgi:uncharacterized protein (DUF1778 family)